MDPNSSHNTTSFNPQSQTSLSQTPNTTPPQDSQRKLIFICIAGIITAIIFTGVIITFMHSRSSQSPFERVKQFIASMSGAKNNNKMSTTDNGKKMNLYTNRQGYFTINYPTDYISSESASITPEEHIGFSPKKGGLGSFSIAVYSNWSPEEALSYIVTAGFGNIIEDSNVIVDGVSGKKIVRRYPGPIQTYENGHYDHQTTYVLSNGKTFTFMGTSFDKTNPENAIFDQMIKTLKFLKREENKFKSSYDISIWKKYTSVQGSYEVMIPLDWKAEEHNSEKSELGLSNVSFSDPKYNNYRLEIGWETTAEDHFRNSGGTCDEDGMTEGMILNSGREVEFTKACAYRATYFYHDKTYNVMVVFQGSFKLKDDPLMNAFISSFNFVPLGPDVALLENGREKDKAKQAAYQTNPIYIKMKSDVESIAKAITQYKKDNRAFPKNLKELNTSIGKTFGDICTDLVPKYLPSLPVYVLYKPRDPISNCNSNYDTGYYYKRLEDGRIKIYAPAPATIESFAE